MSVRLRVGTVGGMQVRALADELLFDLGDRCLMLLHAHAIVGRHSRSEAPERSLRKIEHALAPLEERGHALRVRLRRRKEAGEGRHGVFHGRKRLVRPAVDHARPDVGVLHHDAELERREARQITDVGHDPLIDRDAAGKARRRARTALGVACQERDAREHVPHALHVVVARAGLGRLHVDAVEHQEAVLERCEGFQNRRKGKRRSGSRRQPLIVNRAVRREDDDEALGHRNACVGQHAARQERARCEPRARPQKPAPADIPRHGVTSGR